LLAVDDQMTDLFATFWLPLENLKISVDVIVAEIEVEVLFCNIKGTEDEILRKNV
jgi:hypothetical protein